MLVERGGPQVDPLIIGGGQERERRSGTHNTAGIVAAAVALDLTDRERPDENARLAVLRDALVAGLQDRIDDVVETVPSDAQGRRVGPRVLAGIESEALLFLLDEADVCASAASACASGAMEPSHVLAAMGVDRSTALGSLRLSLGHDHHRCRRRPGDRRDRGVGRPAAAPLEPNPRRIRCQAHDCERVVKVMCAMSGGVDSSVAACCCSAPATRSSASR